MYHVAWKAVQGSYGELGVTMRHIFPIDLCIEPAPSIWDIGFTANKMSKIKRAKAKARKKLRKKLRKNRH